jgi:transposase
MHLPACMASYEVLMNRALELSEDRETSLLFGIEGTGSYGAGLSRHLQAAQCSVSEVNRPSRQTRRKRGKDDVIDAEAATRLLLAGSATAVAKASNADEEILRVLKSTRDLAVRCRTQRSPSSGHSCSTCRLNCGNLSSTSTPLSWANAASTAKER